MPDDSRKSLNRAQYIGADFDSALDEIRARTVAKFGSVFNDFSESSLGLLLWDHMAFAIDTLGFYIDRKVSELYTDTAAERASASRLARQVGYYPKGAVSASA